MIVSIAIAGVVGIAYILAAHYVRRATRSIGSAGDVWAQLQQEVRTFVEKGAAPEIATFAIQLGAVAGCGCFVRGVVMNHYLPPAMLALFDDDKKIEPVEIEARHLDVDQQERLSHIVTLVIMYDSFRNPFQGFLFRRILRSYMVPDHISWRSKVEAKAAAFSVMSRRSFAR